MSHHHLKIILSACAFAAVTLVATAQNASSTFYGISKQLNYVQGSTAAPVLSTTEAGLFEVALPENTAGSFRTPAGVTRNITASEGGFRQFFATRAAMDAAFPDGTYTMSVGNVSGIALSLQPSYPSDIPRVTNGTWNQNRLVVDPAQGFTIQFNTFTNWGAAGTISHAYVSLWEGNGDDIVAVERFSTEPGGPLNSVVIPAGKLVAGHTYNVEAGWFSGTVNSTAVPNAFGFAGGSYQLEFQVAAVAAAPAAPVFTAQPASQTIAAGSTVVFSAAASGSPAPAYQWRRGTTNITGATSSTLVLSGANASAGSYTCVATNSVGNATSTAAVLTVAAAAAGDVGRLVNLAIRTGAGTGAQTLIVGVSTGGAGTSGNKDLLIRAVGPSLAPFGLTGLLADPVATIFQGSTSVATNDNWGGDAQVTARATQVAAFGLTSTASLDAALAFSPAAGSYTVQITGKNNGTGLTLAEIYDGTASAAFTATTPRLINVSARTQVGTGGDVLIAGFVVGGTTAKTVLIRAIGPTLGAFGVTGTLADPRLQLFSGATVLRENDNWGGDAQLTTIGTSVGAFALADATSKDSILLITLPPGSYTAQVSGVGNTTGVALVEVYEVP